MKKTFFIAVAMFLFSILDVSSSLDFRSDVIERIRIKEADVPAGFAYGKIPTFARKVLKENPWMMDQQAIRFLAGRIYPGGDPSRIESIHSTIMADKKRPFNDDIVCYIILYKDSASSREETKKIKNYTELNPSRVMFLQNENVTVFMFVDDPKNMNHLAAISKTIDDRLKRASAAGK